jgi:hypothetical protein
LRFAPARKNRSSPVVFGDSSRPRLRRVVGALVPAGLPSAPPRPLLGSVAGDGEVLASVLSVPLAGMVHRFLSGVLTSFEERYELKQPRLEQDSQAQKKEWQHMHRPQ